jgi:cation:H+ antiporter
MGSSFFGTTFLAASTSMPELVVSFSTILLCSYDMAVSNLLGSNLFNIVILAIDDLEYTGGFLLKDASEAHLISVLSTIIMSAIVIVGLTFRTAPKRFLFAWDTSLIAVVYIINLVLLFRIA